MISVLKQSAIAGGKILNQYFKKSHNIHFKSSHQDFCTDADLHSQEAIKTTIINQLIKKGISHDQIGFIGEEDLSQTISKDHLFIIDPLDGTINFESGLDLFVISIAYFYKNQLKAGLIYRPTANDFYYAIKGQGAFKNNQKLTIEYFPLSQCLLDGVISSKKLNVDMFEIFKNIFPHIKSLRSFFCMALSNCFFTENIINIIINGHTFIWDIAAIKLIIEEAGGQIYDFAGVPIKLDLTNPNKSYQVISCHQKNLVKVLKHIKQP